MASLSIQNKVRHQRDVDRANNLLIKLYAVATWKLLSPSPSIFARRPTRPVLGQRMDAVLDKVLLSLRCEISICGLITRGHPDPKLQTAAGASKYLYFQYFETNRKVSILLVILAKNGIG